MKHCPNLECPFLDAVGRVAKYEDRIDVCPECETELSAGAAPLKLPERLQTDVETMQTVVTVGSEDEAIWIQEELGQMRMMAQVVRVNSENVEPELALSPDGPLFNVRVMPGHVVPAMAVINALVSDDESDNASDQEFDDEFNDDDLDEDELYDDKFSRLDEIESSEHEWDHGESDSAEIVGMGNNFLLIFMVAIAVLVVAALLYGLFGF